MQAQATSKKLADMSAAAGNADRTFRKVVARFSAIYEKKTGRKVPEEMSDFDVMFRSVTDPEFARLNRQICQVRMSLLGY